MSLTRRPSAPKISETSEHRVIASYFKKISLGGNAVAFHIKNDQPTNWQRLNAARMGVLPGIPDWCIINNGSVIFAEQKPRGWRDRKQRTGNYTAHEHRQLATHESLRRAGASVFYFETLDELLTELLARGVPLQSESISNERIRRGFQNAMADIENE